MNLDEYLSQPGSLTPAELVARGVAKSEAQIRQWRHGYADRQPSPRSASALERATEGKVRRWDSRPLDWDLIWDELIGAKGAPPIPHRDEKAA